MNDNFMHNLRAAVDRLVPSYTAAHNARGNELVESGDYDTAIAEFDEAIRLTPSVAELYSDRGRAPAGMLPHCSFRPSHDPRVL